MVREQYGYLAAFGSAALFARDAEVYLDELAGHSLTRQIDEALQTAGADESSSAAVSAGRHRLAKDDW